MRQVVSLSLPATEVRQLRKIVRERGYTSVSSYIQQLFQADKDLISEADLLKTVRAARKEYRQGRSVRAKSLADLV